MRNRKEGKSCMKRENRITSILYLVASVSFFISSIFWFIDKSSLAITNLCLGACFLCLSSVYYTKDKKSRQAETEEYKKS